MPRLRSHSLAASLGMSIGMAIALSVSALQGQSFVPSLNGAVFLEQLHTDVTTQSGSAQRKRIIQRSARYGMALKGDTIVVTAGTIALDETADRVPRSVNVDAVIGGRWRMMLDGPGAPTVLDQPFVPSEIADVSDLGSAMDDFFPAMPPVLRVEQQLTDSSRRAWHRLADSAGKQRYRWSQERHSDSVFATADTVGARAVSDTHETGAMAWDVSRGPVTWTRHIQVTVVSHFAGRTVRAVFDQRIAVVRSASPK